MLYLIQTAWNFDAERVVGGPDWLELGDSAPVEDATGIEGGWDFTFSYCPFTPAAPGGAGGGYTIFESIEKQLGLKLKSQQRMLPVTVIDRLRKNPTEN